MNENITMPVLFIGHGSPMNAIEDNKFTMNWAKIAQLFSRPKAILAISAHWYTEKTRITDAAFPRTVYDMYGFPKELYQIVYPAPGAPELAHQVKGMINNEVTIDNSWGFDHGTWSVLHRMYPEADIPIVQLSVNKNATAEVHYRIGKELKTLREQGVLIFASGNVVHNLQMVNWNMDKGYSWAEEFDKYIKEKLVHKEYEKVIHYEKAGQVSIQAVPTPDHFYPLLYTLGAVKENDELTIYNESCVLGGLSMTSYVFR